MTVLAWVVGAVGAVALALVAAGQFGVMGGAAPADLGVREGRLKPPSKTKNSVSSQAALYPDHPQRAYAEIAPLALRGDGAATIAVLKTIVGGMPGARIVDSRPDYLYAQFTTRWMGFVDDTEFWFDPSAGVVQVRSASRVGEADFGVNRARVEAIRGRLAERPMP